MDPLTYETSFEEAFSRLEAALNGLSNVEWFQKQSRYIHVGFRSKVFGFVDDVEFYFPEEEPLIHFRSASRLGHSDFGVNRKRMEQIRQVFQKYTFSAG